MSYYCSKCRVQREQGCFSHGCPGIPDWHNPSSTESAKPSSLDAVEHLRALTASSMAHLSPRGNPRTHGKSSLMQLKNFLRGYNHERA